MLGYWNITEIIDGEKLVKAESALNKGVIGFFYLPPLNRLSTSDIKVGDKFYGILDTNSGYGALLCMVEGNDFAHKFKYDLNIEGALKVTDNIQSVQGDVIATQVSLQQHTHALNIIYPNDVIAIATGVASVATGVATPIELTTTYTNTPK